MVQTSRSMGRIWPDGEFVLWSEVSKEVFDPEQASPLGLSELANSHKAPEECKERLRRGLGGVTRYGQRMIKCGAELLQRKYGARRLSFLTCTIPGSPEDTVQVAMEWDQICRIFYQKLQRKLKAEGLSTAVVGVTEIQPKRFLRTGGMPLHLHIVFHGAPVDNCWAFPPDAFTKWWKDSVSARVPSQAKQSYAAATNVQRVKNSASGYLGKYMSKGAGDIAQILEEAPTVVDALPHCWYNLSSTARNAVKRYTRYGPEVGEMLERWRVDETRGACHFKFIGLGMIRNEVGDVLASFRFGSIMPTSFASAGIPLTKWQLDEL